jgi:glycosyltransferase involved in cell wall biosynthesis
MSKASLRVLIVEAAGNLWGSERALLDLLNGMLDLEVAVCCPPKTALNGELKKRHIRTLPYYVYGLHEKSRWQRLRAAIGTLWACLEFTPDIIYLNQSGSYKVILPAATLLNLPIVAHIRIFEDVAYLAAQSPSPNRLRSLIAISLAVEAEIRQFHELKAIPVQQIYDSYIPWIEPCPTSVPVRAVNRVACVGRLVPMKGQDVFIRALDLLQDVNGGLECLMVGDGEADYVQKLKQLASNEKIASSLHWLGFVGEVVPLLWKCSVLACPSHREPLGRVIFEAWDAGAIPVVFAGSGGAAEIVVAAEGGIVYEEQTPESLAKALREALQLSLEQRAHLIGNGRAWMTKNCDSEAYGEAMATILTHSQMPKGNTR